MEIQPLQPVAVLLIPRESDQIVSHLIDISSDKIRVLSQDYLEMNQTIEFKSRFFYGQATVTLVEFAKNVFTYTLDIVTIHFKPGLVINEVL